jgi:hypothetical protein
MVGYATLTHPTLIVKGRFGRECDGCWNPHSRCAKKRVEICNLIYSLHQDIGRSYSLPIVGGISLFWRFLISSKMSAIVKEFSH